MEKFDIDIYKIIVVIYMIASFVLALAGRAAELGYFVIAGALGLVFLKIELFEQFSGAGFSAKLRRDVSEIKKDLEPIKAKETEPEKSIDGVKRKLDSISTNQVAVLDAVANSQFSWRTVSGIAEDTGLTRQTILRLLHELSDDGLVLCSGKGRRTMWGATEDGHILSIL